MVTLDSVKMAAPREAVTQFDDSSFETSIKVSGNRQLKNEIQTLEPMRRVYGLNKLELKHDEVVIEMSAKILHVDYAKLINIDTIEQALWAVNDSDGVAIDPRIVLDFGRFLRVDVTNDIRCSLPIHRYIGALAMYNSDARYNVTQTRSGVYFNNKSRYVNFYSKYEEMMKCLDNLLQWVDPKDFENVLRMENRLPTFKLIRDSFQSSTLIQDVLQSKVHVNARMFDRLRQPAPPVLFEYEPGKVKFYDVVKYVGYKELLRQCEMDWRKFRKLVMQYSKGDPTTYVNFAKRVLAEIEIHAGNRFDLISEIAEVLNVA